MKALSDCIVPLLLATSLLVTSMNTWADNYIDIQGGGNNRISIDTSTASNSTIDIYQVSVDLENKATLVSQSGSNHTARIGQGGSYANGNWTPEAAVSDNSATIIQSSVNADTASIYQTSSSNTASISQMNSNQVATMTQSGSNLNSATLSQNGSIALQANIIQNGAVASTLIATQAAANAYMLTVTQGGSGGHYASLETTSDYNGAGLSVNQTGATNSTTITGMSGGSASIIQSGTGGNLILTNQTSGTLAIEQQGINNALSITHYGAGSSLGQALSVIQTGTTTYNPSPAPTGPDYVAPP